MAGEPAVLDGRAWDDDRLMGDGAHIRIELEERCRECGGMGETQNELWREFRERFGPGPGALRSSPAGIVGWWAAKGIHPALSAATLTEKLEALPLPDEMERCASCDGWKTTVTAAGTTLLDFLRRRYYS